MVSGESDVIIYFSVLEQIYMKKTSLIILSNSKPFFFFIFPDISSNPPVQSYTPLFISKWIDYSNKYGFGYQLSDHSVGVFFNDLTRISISTDKR